MHGAQFGECGFAIHQVIEALDNAGDYRAAAQQIIRRLRCSGSFGHSDLILSRHGLSHAGE